MKKILILTTAIIILTQVFTFSVSASDIQNSICRGDANGDGETDSLDATLVLKYDAGMIDFTAEQKEALDVNSDGNADSMDAALILKYDAGLITAFDQSEQVESITLDNAAINDLTGIRAEDLQGITDCLAAKADGFSDLNDAEKQKFIGFLTTLEFPHLNGRQPDRILYYPEIPELFIYYTIRADKTEYVIDFILNEGKAEMIRSHCQYPAVCTYKIKNLEGGVAIPEPVDGVFNSFGCYAEVNGVVAMFSYYDHTVDLIAGDELDRLFFCEDVYPLISASELMIKEDYAKYNNELYPGHDRKAEDVVIREKYGPYHGAYVMFINFKDSLYPAMIGEETVAGITFRYPTAQAFDVYKGGAFISLSEAYANGVLSSDDLSDLAAKYYERNPHLAKH